MTLRYEFEHDVLPRAIFAEPREFFLVMPIDAWDQALQGLYAWCAQALGVEPDRHYVIAKECLPVFGYPTVFLRMPPPCVVPEAHFVAVLYQGNLGEPVVPERVRYFTLEAGLDADERPRTVFCEWTIGREHRNYGDGPAADDKLAFLGAVAALLRSSGAGPGPLAM